MNTICRRELKFVVSKSQLAPIRGYVRKFLIEDAHSQSGLHSKSYGVRSLYFETHDFKFFSEKAAGVGERLKLRVRSYFPLRRSGPVIAEIKKKKNEVISKERCAISAASLDLLLDGRYGEALEKENQAPVLRRFIREKVASAASLPIIVDYDRESYQHVSKNHYERVTFDSEICAYIGRDFFSSPKHRFAMSRFVVIEMKFDGKIPYWMTYLIEKFNLVLQPFSKFQLACGRFQSR